VLLNTFKKGDSISVTGTVQETNDVTRLSVTAATKLDSGKVLPAPVILTTNNFGVANGNGSPAAEQWEGMLVRFNNVTITDLNPTFADQKEYSVSDGSGDLLVRVDGKNMYSNVAGDTSRGKTILNAGGRFSYIQGVMWFAFQRYKLVPRGNEDFGTYLATSVDQEIGYQPNAFALSQNYPNPFNPVTNIQYDMPAGGFTSLRVYNLLGQEVRTLVNQYQAAGRYTAQFDGSRLPSGVYVYRLQSESGIQVRRMVLLK
jgi:hypothetical protein